jgi:hypothetical protein
MGTKLDLDARRWPIINRTFVYVPLSAIIAGTYIAAITLFRSLFVSLTGQSSDAAIVLTTLVVAAALHSG